MAKIFEKIISINVTLNKSFNTKQIKDAKKELDISAKLLLKGYCLEDDQDLLLTRYKHINKVPLSKDESELTTTRLNDIGGYVFSKIPKDHGFSVMVFKEGTDILHYVSNADRDGMIKVLDEMKRKINQSVKRVIES